MADTATPSLTVAQGTDPYKMWNSDDWFDNVRWSLSGTMTDSDFKSGLWWKDGEAMLRAAPILRQFADQWRDQIAALKAQKQKVDQSSQTFSTNQGVNAARTTSDLADISRAIQSKIEDLTPVPNGLENAASILERNAPTVEHYWNKWENDRANFESCHADVVAMQGPISNMARALLQAADSIQTPWKNSLKAPKVTVPANTGGNSSIDPETQAQLNSGATPAQLAQKASAQTNGTTSTTVATPGVVTSGGAGTTAGGSAGSTAGTVVSNGASGGPSLAGGGFGSSFAGGGGGGGAAGGAAGAGAGGFGSTPGAMPAAASGAGSATAGSAGSGFAPGFFGGMGGGVGAGGTRRSEESAPKGGTPLFPVAGDEDDAVGGRTIGARGVVGAPPLIGGTVGERANGRRGNEIRPGYANRPRTSGVAEGLLGRAAKDSEFGEVIGSTGRRRRPNKRRGSDERETVQFLDEEAWLTDDPGSGVVTSEDSSTHKDVAAPRFGTPSVG